MSPSVIPVVGQSFSSLMLTGIVVSMGLSSAWNVALAEPPPSSQRQTEQTQPAQGQAIYAAKCASCHGEHGEGQADEYAQPLAGDWALSKLTGVIARTMPEGEPDTCVEEDAAAVAQYVYDTFYSPTAQLRNAPPTVELSRLTAAQYRNSVADLTRSLTGQGGSSDERGAKVEYFQSKNFDRKHLKLERLEPSIDFQFGTKSPIEGQPEGEAFSMSISSSLHAPETGTYQFILRSPNAAVLRFNDQPEPLIDAKIKSGDQIEYSATVFLLAGRRYPFRMEYYRGEFGSKKVGKIGGKEASLQLLWRRPSRLAEVIPNRYLEPVWFPRQLTVTVPFPPDDSSVGYARGITVSRAWDEATTDAALEVGNFLADHLDAYAKTKSAAKDREAKILAMCETIVQYALRHPLSDAERQRYINRHFEAAESLEQAVRRVVLVALKSPHFLYPDLPIENASDSQRVAYQRANRLALALWDSVPDDSLFTAAGKDWLESDQQLRNSAERMVEDPRSKAKVHEFLHHWLRVNESSEMTKDSQAYPDFTPEIVSDLRESLDLFLDDVVWSEESDYRQLLTDQRIYLNPRLAAFYGVEMERGVGFQDVSLPTERSAGVLSHPLLMAGFAYSSATSPIHRGVFLARSVLGRSLRPPPIAVAPLSPDLHADLSTRQRVTLQTQPAACVSCHELINPLGFAFEQFDAVGRFRKDERGKPIDASGVYLTRGGDEVAFEGVRELADFLSDSQEAHESFVSHLFEHVTKQPIAAYGTDRLPLLTSQFVDSGFNIRKLLVEIALIYADGPPPTKS